MCEGGVPSSQSHHTHTHPHTHPTHSLGSSTLLVLSPPGDTTIHASCCTPNLCRHPGPVRVTPLRVRRPPAGALVGRARERSSSCMCSGTSGFSAPASDARSTASSPVAPACACSGEPRNAGSAARGARPSNSSPRWMPVDKPAPPRRAPSPSPSPAPAPAPGATAAAPHANWRRNVGVGTAGDDSPPVAPVPALAGVSRPEPSGELRRDLLPGDRRVLGVAEHGRPRPSWRFGRNRRPPWVLSLGMADSGRPCPSRRVGRKRAMPCVLSEGGAVSGLASAGWGGGHAAGQSQRPWRALIVETQHSGCDAPAVSFLQCHSRAGRLATAGVVTIAPVTL